MAPPPTLRPGADNVWGAVSTRSTAVGLAQGPEPGLRQLFYRLYPRSLLATLRCLNRAATSGSGFRWQSQARPLPQVAALTATPDSDSY